LGWIIGVSVEIYYNYYNSDRAIRLNNNASEGRNIATIINNEKLLSWPSITDSGQAMLDRIS
jgi:hypothetical protein